MSVSRTEIERDVAIARDAHVALLDRLETRLTGGDLDPGGPSALPGWTRGHVLTHLARNADSHRGMIEAAGRGEVAAQYPPGRFSNGVDRRNGDIDAGAGRPAEELVDDVRTASAALEAAWASTDWQGSGRRTLAGAETPIAELLFLRLREVSVHHVDLDIGTTFSDLDRTYVRMELRRREMAWRSRLPMGMTGIPPALLALAEPDRLAWFLGRRSVDGLPDVTF